MTHTNWTSELEREGSTVGIGFHFTLALCKVMLYNKFHVQSLLEYILCSSSRTRLRSYRDLFSRVTRQLFFLHRFFFDVQEGWWWWKGRGGYQKQYFTSPSYFSRKPKQTGGVEGGQSTLWMKIVPFIMEPELYLKLVLFKLNTATHASRVSHVLYDMFYFQTLLL